MWASPFTFSAHNKSLDERILQIMFRQREQSTVTIISELISQPSPFFIFFGTPQQMEGKRLNPHLFLVV